MMPETLDPSELQTYRMPAFVTLVDGTELFVGDSTVTEQGWLRVDTWGGERTHYPPQQVRSRTLVETETAADGDELCQFRRVTDDQLRHEARELGGVDRSREAIEG